MNTARALLGNSMKSLQMSRSWLTALSMLMLLLLPVATFAQGVSADARTGTLTPVATADLQQPVAFIGQTISTSIQSRPKGGRRIPSPHFALAAVGKGPEAAETPLEKGESSDLLRNFNGVSSLDSAVTNFGAEFEPPDQGLCVGNGFVVEPVNSAFTVYRKDGAAVAGPFNVNVLFAEGLTEFTSDPRCYYDRSTNTWFATILFIASDNLSARTDVAVNASGDPTKPWTVYHLDATNEGTNGTPNDPGCPCLGDQPLLGIDNDNVYISTNEFSILGPQFNGAQIYALSKSDLIRGRPLHYAHFGNLTIGGAIAASVQPAITNGDAPAEYFLSSLDPNGTTDNRIGVWALTHGERVSDGGTPTLSSLVINSEAYGLPPNAVQEGSSSLLATDDDRMQQVQFINGNLWGALTTVLTPKNDTVARSAVAWFKVHPRLSGDAIGAAHMSAEGYVAANDKYLFYPAIQASDDGNVAMVMTLSGETNYASAAYVLLSDKKDSFGPIKIASAGTGPYDPQATRWGDYSAAVLDPDGKSFWLATEYVPPFASQTPDGLRNWGTRVLQVSAENRSP